MIEYAGVRVRLMEKKDISALWELHTPAIFEHMLTKVGSFEQMKVWLEAGMGRPGVIALVVEEEAGEIIGTTRIASIDLANKSCEIGSTFYAERVQRSGVNTAVKFMLLRHCFEELGMIRVQFKTDAENGRSQKALERIGAIKEGVLRNERIRSTGKPRDAVLYSIIDREWQEVKEKLLRIMNKYT